MPEYHLYNRDTQQFVKLKVAYPAMNEARVEGLASNLVFLRVETPTPPPYDPETEQLSRASYTISDPGPPETLGTATVVWQVVPKQPSPVPTKVTPRQLKQWLLAQNKYATVLAVLDALPEPNRTAAHIDWDSALYFERTHPLIASLAQILGMTQEEVDDAFREASQID